MAARKTIAKLEPNPLKQQEMDFLREVAASVPDNSYLASLFNGDFCRWVEAQIRQDVSCDLWGALNYANSQVLEARGSLQEANKKHAEEMTAFQAAAEAAQDVAEECREKLARTEEKAQLLKDRWHEALEETKSVQDEVYHAQTEIDRLHGEIVVLKAKLYDLMVKGP